MYCSCHIQIQQQHLRTDHNFFFSFFVQTQPWDRGGFSKGAFGSVSYQVRTKVYRGYLLGDYFTEVFGEVRHGLNTLPHTPVRYGTHSIPVPDTPVSSVRPQIPVPNSSIFLVRPQHWYPTIRQGYTGGIYPTEVVRYDLNTPPNTPVWFGMNSKPAPDKFGTTSIPVPYTSGSSVRPHYWFSTSC